MQIEGLALELFKIEDKYLRYAVALEVCMLEASDQLNPLQVLVFFRSVWITHPEYLWITYSEYLQITYSQFSSAGGWEESAL